MICGIVELCVIYTLMTLILTIMYKNNPKINNIINILLI